MRLLLLILLTSLVVSQSDAQNLQFRSATPYPSEMSDVWGYAADGKEYALATYEDGFSVVDVTDPDNPEVLHDVPGPNTFWRDVKTFGHYAYGIHESTGLSDQGLVIMDLSQLPDALPVTFWNTDGTPDLSFRNAHNIFIDENGIIYLIGGNVASGGVLMLDASINPTNPQVVGKYDQRYVHDAFARNDTLWTAEVGAGQFSIIDIRFKNAPIVLARQSTPLTFTHNIWVSDDGNTAFATDERSGAYLAAYDVSDVSDIKEIDRYRAGGPGVIPHNAFVLNEFVVVSWYAHGIIILDATFPDELVEVGRFDTAPNYPNQGFHGAWGVYPYLPSGNIIVTDIEEGLIVLSPDYKNASHIRGVVKNADNGEVLSGAEVEVIGPEGSTDMTTSLDGTFKQGQVIGGSFTINVSKVGFESESMQIVLEEGEVEEIEVELTPISYVVTDTIEAEIVAGGDDIKVCDEDTDGIEVDFSFVCGELSQSDLGSWTVDTEGCLTYTALPGSGDQTDEICFVVQNNETDEFNVNLVIINILAAPTAVNENAFTDGSFSLLTNPVGTELSIQHFAEPLDYIFEVLDLQGKLLSTTNIEAFSSSITIPVNELRSGLYLLSVKQGNEALGFVKFVKE